MKSHTSLGNLIAPIAILVVLTSFGWAEGQRFAILVGIDNYRDDALDFDKDSAFCSNDAEKMASILKNRFQFTDVKTLIAPNDKNNRMVKVAEIRQALDHVVGRARDGDTVLFYFSGHGQQIKGWQHLLASDKRIPAQEIRSKLEESGASTILFFIDACRNVPATHKSSGYRMGYGKGFVLKPDYQKRKRAAVFYSCSQDQLSRPYPKKQMGAFSYALTTYLENNKAIIPGELDAYLERTVRRLVGEELGTAHPQVPDAKIFPESFEYEDMFP